MASEHHGRRTAKFKQLRRRVLESSDICWLCGQPGADTVDHVVPLSVDPTLGEALDNLRPAHARCNYARGARSPRHVEALNASRRW